MNDLLKKLSQPLTVNEIDFRVQSINKGGYAKILAYKDARVDINRLNAVVGPLGWKREHVNGNHNCIVSLYNEKHGHWVSKEDTGTESMTEKEKGLASDSFKRACFNWGIGIELYDYPAINVKLNKNEFEIEKYFDNFKKKEVERVRQTWDLKLNEWVWRVDVLDRVVTYMAAKDQDGNIRFVYGSPARKALLENQQSVNAIVSLLDNEEYAQAAEAWFEMTPQARRDLYVAEKHGGPFTAKQREVMRQEFQQYFNGEVWNEGLFSVQD